jgi:MFS family permease
VNRSSISILLPSFGRHLILAQGPRMHNPGAMRLVGSPSGMEAHEGNGPAARRRPSQRKAVVGLLRRNRDFRLLFLAQVVSFSGDWFLFVALAGLVYSLTRSPSLVAMIIVANTIPFALASLVGGSLADRLNRQWLMIGADLARGVLALGFFLVHSRSDVWMVYVLSGAIAALGALFEPASSAALPNLVDPEDLGPANVLASSAWGTMLAVGAGIGGLVVAAFGRSAGYAGDALSFFLSASLLMGIRRPFAEPREPHHEHPNLVQAASETIRYARRDPRVLALLSVKGGFGLSVGVVGLLPVLALQTFHAGDTGTGILYGLRGVGALIGPFLFRWFLRDEDDLSGLFVGLSVALSSYGVFYALAPWAPSVYVAGLLVMCGHFGGGGQWMLSTYGLQRIVPDRIRGRVFAFDYGLVTLTLALSSAVAGKAADVFGVRIVILALGCLGVAFGLVWTLATARLRRSLRLARRPGGSDDDARLDVDVRRG